MFRTATVLAMILVAAAGCSRAPARDAAGSVQGFLAAAQAGDQAGFEAGLDRPAVRADLRRQLVAVARANGVEVDGGPSDLALDRMIVPEAVRQVEAEAGGPLPAGADAAALEARLKKAGDGAVCLHDGSPEARCLLTFVRQKAAHRRPAAWRLVGMQAPDHDVDIGVNLGS